MEYQHYEFRALQRRLSPEQQAALRALSSRARITDTSFVNHYNYGDFKGDPSDLLRRSFDLHLYWTSWGRRSLSALLPQGVFTKAQLALYLVDDRVELKTRRSGQVLTMTEPGAGARGEDAEDADWMQALEGVYGALAGGDARPLYIAWLSAAAHQLFRDSPGAHEPPVPAGLGDLPSALTALARFLRVSPTLLEAAASASDPRVDGGDARRALASWVDGLTEQEARQALREVLEDHEGDARARWLQGFRASEGFAALRSAQATPSPRARRTVDALLNAAERLEQARAGAEAAATRQRAHERAARRAARGVELDQVAREQDELWNRAAALVEERNRVSYARAVEALGRLRDLALRDDQLSAYRARLAPLLKTHGRKISFMSMVESEALLIEPDDGSLRAAGAPSGSARGATAPPTRDDRPRSATAPPTRDDRPRSATAPPTRDDRPRSVAAPPTRDDRPRGATAPPTRDTASPPTRDSPRGADAVASPVTAWEQTALARLDEALAGLTIADAIAARARLICARGVQALALTEGNADLHAASALYCAVRLLEPSAMTQAEIASAFGISGSLVSRFYRSFMDAAEG